MESRRQIPVGRDKPHIARSNSSEPDKVWVAFRLMPATQTVVAGAGASPSIAYGRWEFFRIEHDNAYLRQLTPVNAVPA